MRMSTITVTFLLAMLGGCTLFASKQPVTLTTGKATVTLDFINAANAIEKFQADAPPDILLVYKANESEEKVLQQCGVTKEDLRRYKKRLEPFKMLGFPFFLPVLSFFSGPAIDFALGEVERRFAEELKKYVAAYSASTNLDFYAPAPQAAPELAWTCFRVTRAIVSGSDRTVVMDLIGQLWLSPDKDALKIRPLRVYYAKAKAKGDRVGISVSVNAQAIWRDHNVGKNEKIFEYTLLSEKFDMTSSADDLIFYPTESWHSRPFLPLIPWSTNRDISLGGGHVMFTLTVAEIGAPPKILEAAADLFRAKKGELAKLMNNAANELLSSRAE